MSEIINDELTPDEEIQEDKKVKFKGASGQEFEVDENLYNDFMKKATGEKLQVKSQYEKQLEEITGKYSELENNFKELQKSTMSEKERLELEQAEKEQAFLNVQQEAQKNYQLYESARVDAEVSRIINKYSDKLVSPSHMQVIIKSVLNPTLKDNGIICNDKDLETAFNEYISLEENKALLRNNLNAGSGSNVNTSNSNQYSKQSYTREDLKDPKYRKEYYERKKNGENVIIQD